MSIVLNKYYWWVITCSLLIPIYAAKKWNKGVRRLSHPVLIGFSHIMVGSYNLHTDQWVLHH